MEQDNRNAYSEVIEILKLIDDEKMLEALPMEMLEVLKSKANPEYKPVISMEIPLEEQNLQKETMSILGWIATTYWKDEINYVENIFVEPQEEKNYNTQKYGDEEISNTQKCDDITSQTMENVEANNTSINESIENNQISDVQENSNIENRDNNMLVVYKELKWYERIKIKILEFFNKIFKSKKNNQEAENKG